MGALRKHARPAQKKLPMREKSQKIIIETGQNWLKSALGSLTWAVCAALDAVDLPTNRVVDLM
jgi:hypothetical protein